MEIHQTESGVPSRNMVSDTVKSNRGFTLIEILMVCTIIGILVTLSYGGYSSIRNRTKVATAGTDLRNIEKDIYAFASERGTFPPDLATIGRQDFLDPWGVRYVYAIAAVPAGAIGPDNRSSVGKPINTDFDLYSKGSNRVSVESIQNIASSIDDIIRGRDGSYVGMADHY